MLGRLIENVKLGKRWYRTDVVVAININDGANRTQDRGTTLTQMSTNFQEGGWENDLPALPFLSPREDVVLEVEGVN